MAQTDIILPADATAELPVVRSIGPADLRDALAKGLDDFREMPTHALFLGLIYPIVGIALGAATVGYDIVPLLYPLAAGFALIGPFAAVGLYELSRRRELGLDTSWQHAFDVLHSPSLRSIAALGCLLLVIFFVWLATANAIYVGNFGLEPAKPGTFLRDVLTTARPKKMGREPTTSAPATNRPHSDMVTGFFQMTLSEVMMATATPTSRSSRSGNDTTLRQ